MTVNMAGQRLKFIADEAVAFTLEEGRIISWEADNSGPFQVFVSKDRGKKAVLHSDEGRWWDVSKKEAENCFYAERWFGEFPYGSYGYGFRVCKHTGAIHVESFSTEINPCGPTGQDLFRRDCKVYVP